MEQPFPTDFLWGTATASYQIEGAINADGRGPSIWDRFSHLPGKIVAGDTGDLACDHYHRWPQDIQIMHALGLNAYRTSVSWSRIFPEGNGQPNQAGIYFYQKLVDQLLEASIEPVLTIYHWDLPAKLQEQGGWANRDLVEYYRDYACYLFDQLGDRVKLWITHNEPAVHTIMGHLWGTHAPGISDWKTALQTAHHLLVSHGTTVQSFRQGNQRGQIGITLNLAHFEPASDEAADLNATRRMDGLWNRWFLDPLFRGSYPEDLWEIACNHQVAPEIQESDLALIRLPLDFLGVNYYFREKVTTSSDIPILAARSLPAPPPTTAMGWEIYPEGLAKVLLRVKSDYQDLPIYITENGAAFPDQLIGDTVQDPERIAYLQAHFEQAAAAIQAGVQLKGYFVWSLLDNFEWAYGYSKRFGLIYIDYPTQKRYWKQSAYWYQNIIRQLRQSIIP